MGQVGVHHANEFALGERKSPGDRTAEASRRRPGTDRHGEPQPVPERTGDRPGPVGRGVVDNEDVERMIPPFSQFRKLLEERRDVRGLVVGRYDDGQGLAFLPVHIADLSLRIFTKNYNYLCSNLRTSLTWWRYSCPFLRMPVNCTESFISTR